jgi:hypothetical protein
MNFITIKFALISKYFPMFEDYPQSYDEAKLWWKNIRMDDRMADGSVNPIPPFIRKMKAFFEKWYGKVTGAFIFAVTSRWLNEFMNPAEDEEDED